MSDAAALTLVQSKVVPSEDPAELYEHAPCGYLSTLPDDTIIKVNQTFLTWTGYDRDDLVGTLRLTDLLTGGARIYHETHFRPTLTSTGSIWEVALDLRCADGRRLPVLLNAILARDERGEPRVIRISVFDATLRREYEQELVRARDRAEASEAHARELALTLQASLLPPLMPSVDGLDIGASYRPVGDGAEVGGDFYDVFEAADGDWIIAIGDVCGKGVAAAAVTGLARYAIRASSISKRRPKRVLEDVNTVLLSDQTERFCTATCMRVHLLPDGRARVTFAIAGHPNPILIGGDGVRPVGRGGRLLGVVPTTDLHETTVVLEPGQGLLSYTDGLTEARQGQVFLGEEGVLKLAHERREDDAQALATGLADAAVAFQGGDIRDDIAVIYLRVPPTA